MSLTLDPKQQLIFEFMGNQVRFIQSMIALGVPKEEIFQLTKMKRDTFNTAYRTLMI